MNALRKWTAVAGLIGFGTLNACAEDQLTQLARKLDRRDGSPASISVCPDPRPGHRRPAMQIALLLDTSNSMDGLINQAKTQLWRVVNELAASRRGGRAPVISVALYEYGNSRLSPETGYIRMVLPFTTDLDEVSQRLFSLSTCGGDEYCGEVINRAVQELAWSGDDDTYKAVFIAGNEPFTQGRVHYANAVSRAARKGINVNTVFCGDYHEGVQTSWKDGAARGCGEYMYIDHTMDVVCVRTPYDDEIARLGAAMNDTFVAYGREGEASRATQLQADASAAAAPASGAAMERTLFKAKAQYSESASWDLVNVFKRKGAAGISRRELPGELASKSDKELEAYVASKEKERQTLQQKIGELEGKRKAYIAQAAKNNNGKATLDTAIIQAVRKQAKDRKFEFTGK